MVFTGGGMIIGDQLFLGSQERGTKIEQKFWASQKNWHQKE